VTIAQERWWWGKEAEVPDIYSSVLVVASAALLLVFSGFAKNQLAWKRSRATFMRRRRR
jgi:hypothetical protein